MACVGGIDTVTGLSCAEGAGHDPQIADLPVPGWGFDRRTGQYLYYGTPQGPGSYESAFSVFQQQQLSEQRQLKSTPTSSSSSSTSTNYLDPQAIALQREQMGLDLLKLQQEQGQFQTNQQYLAEKLKLEREAGRSADARATQALQEQIQSRLDSNAFNQARTIAEAQALQAQLDFQANQANAGAQMQAQQINQQREQANLEQRRGVANDIASFSKTPGDIGANAAYLTAGGAAPISRALATGQDARTEQSLVPLDLLLTSRDELAKGPTPFMPSMVTAPRVPIPTFAQQAPLPAFAPPPQPAGGEGWSPAAQQQAVQIAQNFNTNGGDALAAVNAMNALAQGNVIPAAKGFFGTVDEPTLFLAGEGGGPETVNISPRGPQQVSVPDLIGMNPPMPGGNVPRPPQQVSVPNLPNTQPNMPGVTNPQRPRNTPFMVSDPMNQNPGWQDMASASPQPAVNTPQPPSASRDFLNAAYQEALARTPWAKRGTPSPVALSTPGTSPFLQEMAAALAALGQGIDPSLYLNEAARSAPTGLGGAGMRRTR